MRSYSIVTVLDLCRKIHPVIGERQRTNPNETEIETAREPATDCAHTRRPLPPQPPDDAGAD